MKTRQQFVTIEIVDGKCYLRLMEKLLPSRGKQPPMMNPRATPPARISPHGRSIEFQNTNFRLTKLAFWTDNSAMRTIHAAAIDEIIKFVMAFAPLNSRLTSTY
jgi:hypothetical protein